MWEKIYLAANLISFQACCPAMSTETATQCLKFPAIGWLGCLAESPWSPYVATRTCIFLSGTSANTQWQAAAKNAFLSTPLPFFQVLTDMSPCILSHSPAPLPGLTAAFMPFLHIKLLLCPSCSLSLTAATMTQCIPSHSPPLLQALIDGGYGGSLVCTSFISHLLLFFYPVCITRL